MESHNDQATKVAKTPVSMKSISGHSVVLALQSHFFRVLTVTMLLYATYIGYKSWFVLRSSFILSPEDVASLSSPVSSVPSYKVMTERIESRLNLPSLSSDLPKDPFQ